MPYDTDGSPAVFSDTERRLISDIWHRVSEDFASFNIDVTTERPASFGPTTGHVMITKDTDANGAAMPSQGYGGVAYVGVWGYSNYAYYSPAFVYYNNLGTTSSHNIAEASSHEFGHNLSLSHDGTPTSAYYSGHGTGNVSWAPIMGVGYYRQVTQWSKGEYPNANNTQDDVAIIGSKLAFRADDHGGNMAAASMLVIDPSGEVWSSNPEDDPVNLYPENKGVIEDSSDVDFFSFDAAGGPLSLTITPAWDAFYNDSKRGANLDIEATLYDSIGNVMAFSDPNTDTYAGVSADVSSGRYYLAVTGVGNSVTPYSDYASLGQYFISGTVTTSPLKADFTFTTSGLTADFTDASTDSDGIINSWSWSFGDGGSSAMQNPSHTYAAGGSYIVTLTVTDNMGGADSIQKTVAVAAPPSPPAAPSNLSATVVTSGDRKNKIKTVTLRWQDNSYNEQGFTIQRCTETGKGASRTCIYSDRADVGADTTTFTETAGTGTFRYRVRGWNENGSSGYSNEVKI